jgi:PAS domain S-box-containing protein
MDLKVRDPTASLRNESRHAFLLALDDALRPLADPVEIQATASRVLGEHLGVNRVAYFDVRDEHYVIERDYVRAVPTLVGRYPAASFGSNALAQFRRGQTAIATDVSGDVSLTVAERSAYALAQVGAYVAVPLIKSGRFVVGLGVHSMLPRNWTTDEIALVQETAERTWATVERARAEEALARSEEKYRTLFTHIDEAFALCELLYDEQGRPCDRRLLEANPRYQEMVGPRARIGTTAREVFPDIEDHWFELYHEVVTTGNAARFENFSRPLGRWFDVYLSRVGGPGSRLFAAVFNETTDRKRREADLTFLSEISRDLVTLTSIRETMDALGAKIGRHLQVACCAFAEIDDTAGLAMVSFEWHDDRVPSIVGTYRIGDFLTDELRTVLRSGQDVSTADVNADARLHAERFAALGVRAFIFVPIIAEGAWRFVLFIHSPVPRRWREDEIALMRDLTGRIWARLERARAEEALQASDRRHRALFSQMVGGVAEADLSGRFTSVNRRYCEMVGYSAAELLALSMQQLSHPEDGTRHLVLVQRMIQEGDPFEIEMRYLRRDGSLVWVHNSVSLVRAGAGQPLGIVVVSVDITERKQQDEQLRRGAELLNTIIDSSPAGFYIVDADFRISHLNAGARERAFRNVNPAVGRRFDEAIRVLWPEPLASDIIRIFRHTLDTGEPYKSPGLVAARADIPVVETYDWELQRITMPDGRHAVVCYYYDTTRLREVEQELREADRRKDEFLATLSHELRNPLAPIRNGLHYLRRRLATPELVDVHQMMERQLTHLVRLVDDLMEVSRITRGKVELRNERVDLATVIHAAVETSRPLIDASRHELSVSLWNEPLILDADTVRLTQVFANLLNNASKYTDNGGRIVLSTRREREGAVISVLDNGIGISPDMLGKVFDLFTQADRTPHRAQGGLGIGLTLVRSIVTLHGGTIEAHSRGEDQGSEFIVWLPLAG